MGRLILSEEEKNKIRNKHKGLKETNGSLKGGHDLLFEQDTEGLEIGDVVDGKVFMGMKTKNLKKQFNEMGMYAVNKDDPSKFLKKFVDVGTKDKPYNLSDNDLALNDQQTAAEVMRLRNNITEQINQKSTDVSIIFDSRNDTVELEQDTDRLRKKFASLKLIDFLFSTAEAGELDDTIIGAIGFGLSLAGVNPTFYKVIGNTKGTAMDKPEKFTEKGVVALYPLVGDDDPKIIIRDNNTSNKVEINCSIEMGEDIKQVMLSARSNGYTQATLEIEKVH